MNAYIHLTRAGLRSFFRDRQGVFWSFFFPLFFMFIFGTIFGRKRDQPQIQFKVGIVVPDTSPAAAWVPSAIASKEMSRIIKANFGTVESEQAALKKGERDAVVVFPSNFGS